jgi:hypothetical protein
MASTFPTALDTFTNPTGTSLLTSPDHALQHSDINDAVEALEAKVAIGNTVLGVYQSFTPTWIGLTIGNGTSNFKFARVNNLVHYVGVFTLGSTSAITGTVNVSLPVNASPLYSTLNFVPFGWASCVDVSTVIPYSAIGVGITSINTARIRNISAPAIPVRNTNLSAADPFIWTTGDQIQINFTYEAA